MSEIAMYDILKIIGMNIEWQFSELAVTLYNKEP